MNAEQMEEIKRHFGVVAESLRSDIRQIAEGHATIRHELQDLRGEFRDEFKEMRALMRLSFSQLDQRIRTLESDISTLKARMDRLETSRANFFPVQSESPRAVEAFKQRLPPTFLSVALFPFVHQRLSHSLPLL